MLKAETVTLIKSQKNLLAFSGGGDSTALFFLLIDAEIPFDIALVNYHTRSSSDTEATYARTLAKQYGKQCHIHNAPPISSNFEHEARQLRYDFFRSLSCQEGYTHLLTAHHLGDRLEWMLMQLCKGAGLIEMIGMQPIEFHEDYTLVRPLLHLPKDHLVKYLKQCDHQWFHDDSNQDLNHKRNYFRYHFADKMLQEFSQGIQNSFTYMDEDARDLQSHVEPTHIDQLITFKTPTHRRATLIHIDRLLKQAGFLMRQGDRDALKQTDTVIVGRRYVVAITDAYTFIAPFMTISLEKPFKEQCRILGIEPKLRPYLSQNPTAFKHVTLLLSDRIRNIDFHGE